MFADFLLAKFSHLSEPVVRVSTDYIGIWISRQGSLWWGEINIPEYQRVTQQTLYSGTVTPHAKQRTNQMLDEKFWRPFQSIFELSKKRCQKLKLRGWQQGRDQWANFKAVYESKSKALICFDMDVREKELCKMTKISSMCALIIGGIISEMRNTG